MVAKMGYQLDYTLAVTGTMVHDAGLAINLNHALMESLYSIGLFSTYTLRFVYFLITPDLRCNEIDQTTGCVSWIFQTVECRLPWIASHQRDPRRSHVAHTGIIYAIHEDEVRGHQSIARHGNTSWTLTKDIIVKSRTNEAHCGSMLRKQA
ncbi:hypothetical protein GCM10007207_12760 [Asaia siamensis]|uniref:Uncharacterized protein n=1 Tax=Asaia siamensis TaxID=110479 RepID=A0ABQ1LTH8_9PROT|nr:hypothetical protein AA0323_0595 [Asaia siamensis NRIC 0323]GGC28742.1 hypothetical protein GCM10007207_12760 [Asaia siamensis]